MPSYGKGPRISNLETGNEQDCLPSSRQGDRREKKASKPGVSSQGNLTNELARRRKYSLLRGEGSEGRTSWRGKVALLPPERPAEERGKTALPSRGPKKPENADVMLYGSSPKQNAGGGGRKGNARRSEGGLSFVDEGKKKEEVRTRADGSWFPAGKS